MIRKTHESLGELEKGVEIVACMWHVFLVLISALLDIALRVIFSECRESEDSHEKSIFFIPLGEPIQGK